MEICLYFPAKFQRILLQSFVELRLRLSGLVIDKIPSSSEPPWMGTSSLCAYAAATSNTLPQESMKYRRRSR